MTEAWTSSTPTNSSVVLSQNQAFGTSLGAPTEYPAAEAHTDFEHAEVLGLQSDGHGARKRATLGARRVGGSFDRLRSSGCAPDRRWPSALCALSSGTGAVPAAQSSSVTFSRDVAPILRETMRRLPQARRRLPRSRCSTFADASGARLV